jgi:ABC-2 type transport system permease protein
MNEMSVLGAERIKLLSTRSPWWGAGTAILASAGVSALYAATTVGNGQSPTVASTQVGYVLGMAVVMVIAALAVTTEYSVGTIRTTFMAVPRRGLALAAKTTLVASLAAGIGVVAGFAAWAISLLVLPDADLALRGVDQWRQVAGVGLVYLLAAVIAVAVGILVRSTAAAVSIVLVWSLMAEQLLQVIPGFGETVRPYLPFSAAKDFLTADGPATGGLLNGGPWVSLAYFAVVAAVLLGVSMQVARRRDA